jgi:sialate O-acetylesterase
MKNRIIALTFLFLTLPGFTGPVLGQVRLPRLISDGMVLQRNTGLNIWGWAAPWEKVSVDFAGDRYSTRADASGGWKVVMKPMTAGGPHTMRIEGTNSITVNDILVGDVWLCSGQSNMELPVRRVRPLYEAEIAGAENNSVRAFTVPKRYSFNERQEDLPGGRWVAADPETVLDFSAAAWFFAREINETYGVPVGLIISAYGGSPAEAWISEESLKAFPQHYEELQRFKSDSLIQAIELDDKTRIDRWYERLRQDDEGYKSPGITWHDYDIDTAGWEAIEIPGYWSGTPLNGTNGAVWFRKEITVPVSAAGLPGSLNLGRIVDADSAFVNGTFVGTVSYQYPPRWYMIPAGVLRGGRNMLTVKVISNTGDGGFVPGKTYDLSAGAFRISLDGEWRYRIGAVMPPLAGQTFIGYKPGGLFNAMIAPVLNYRFRGILWYQGESNADRPEEYRSLLPALINDWRHNLDSINLPFIVVQLPNFMEAKAVPGESNWALFREAQAMALALPATGMAVTIDIGEWNDIHPLDKKDVGKRLALAARKVAYSDENVIFSGPEYKGMTAIGRRIILTFDNTGSGLVSKGSKKLSGFTIAGEDMIFTRARARIRGDRVIVRGRKIRNPVAVRYAWADNPAGANLFNREGLPAAPFRTDR